MRWFTADQHFGHANIINLSGRPFMNVTEMNEVIIARWNDRVRPDDTVYVLGDFALGTIADTLPLAKRLTGQKILLPGNHDRVFMENETPKRYEEWAEKYYDVGFGQIIHGISTIGLNEWMVKLSHFPYTGDSREEERFTKARPVDDGSWLLHGHVHEKWRVCGRMINVGVDQWDFAPVSENQIINLIHERMLSAATVS